MPPCAELSGPRKVTGRLCVLKVLGAASMQHRVSVLAALSCISVALPGACSSAQLCVEFSARGQASAKPVEFSVWKTPLGTAPAEHQQAEGTVGLQGFQQIH